MEWYKRTKAWNRIQKLALEMVRRDGKSPTLKTTGGEARSLVPYLVGLSKEVANEIWNIAWHTIHAWAIALFGFQSSLACNPLEPTFAADSARKVCNLYKGMSRAAKGPCLWKLKLKFKMLIEMAGYQSFELGNPSLAWAYKAESFVGVIGAVSASRGGAKPVEASSLRLMNKYNRLLRRRKSPFCVGPRLGGLDALLWL